MTSQLGTHHKGAILLFISDCKTSEMEGEAKSKNRRRKLAHSVVLQTAKYSKLQNPFQHTWHFYACFPKGGKTKTKMDDLRQDSQNGLPTEYFALCSEPFEASCFSRSGTTVDFKRFYLGQSPVLSIYAKPKDSLDIDYPGNEGRLANRFFPRNVLWDPPSLPRNVSIQNPPSPPPPKKSISFRIG